MIDVVSFETAKRLKESGFPQPDRFGQWQAFYKLSGDERRAFITEPRMETETFAPSATDILKELGPAFLLSVGYVLKVNQAERPFVCVETVENISDCKHGFSHNNPAEACAAAWLSIHEKKHTPCN